MLNLETKAKIQKEVEGVLKLHDKKFSSNEISKLVDRWYAAKEVLIKKLRKHPNWNENAMAVLYDYDTKRDLSEESFRSCVNSLFSKIKIIEEPSVVIDGAYNDIANRKKYNFPNLTIGDEVTILSKEKVHVAENWNSYDMDAFCGDTFKIDYMHSNGTGIDLVYVSKDQQSKYSRLGKNILRYTFDVNMFVPTVLMEDDSDTEKLAWVKKYENYVAIVSKMKNIYNIRPKQFVDEELKDSLEKLQIQSVIGQKYSKVLNKLFSDYGLNKDEDYNRIFAKLSDSINPLNIKRHTLLSVHPCDYLHMSYGGEGAKNDGWKSCHNIDDGCYMAGTLSYMCDEVSMIFYTVDKSYEGNEFYNQYKINRQVFCYQNGFLLQSRLYPNYADLLNVDNFRAAVQSIFSIVEENPNMWVLKRGTDWNQKYFRTYKDALHYPDYQYNQYNINTSVLKSKFIDVKKGEMGLEEENDKQEIEYSESVKTLILIGSDCYCIDCGQKLFETSEISCCDIYICSECGTRIDIDEDAIEINGNYYCSDCVFLCKYCNKYCLKSDGTYVESEGEWVCNDCLSDYFMNCYDCGEYIHREDLTYVESEDVYVCRSCCDNNYAICDECGKTVNADNLIYVAPEDTYLCEDCYEKYKEKI